MIPFQVFDGIYTKKTRIHFFWESNKMGHPTEDESNWSSSLEYFEHQDETR